MAMAIAGHVLELVRCVFYVAECIEAQVLGDRPLRTYDTLTGPLSGGR
jgi:hypothetical protein